jgi:hypothetical protein
VQIGDRAEQSKPDLLDEVDGGAISSLSSNSVPGPPSGVWSMEGGVYFVDRLPEMQSG